VVGTNHDFLEAFLKTLIDFLSAFLAQQLVKHVTVVAAPPIHPSGENDFSRLNISTAPFAIISFVDHRCPFMFHAQLTSR
jgi:hypothetical protein